MDVPNIKEIGGQELIEQVASLSGLPEPLAQQELSDILKMTGQDAGELTLEQLRSAMLVYLEAMQSSMVAEESPQ